MHQLEPHIMEYHLYHNRSPADPRVGNRLGLPVGGFQSLWREAHGAGRYWYGQVISGKCNPPQPALATNHICPQAKRMDTSPSIPRPPTATLAGGPRSHHLNYAHLGSHVRSTKPLLAHLLCRPSSPYGSTDLQPGHTQGEQVEHHHPSP